MRDFKGMKRQRGRNRGSGGGGGNGGGKPQHNANRAFDSNGPEGIKVRGAAQGVFEKYQQLARDAQTGGDRVLAENYLQHAEHYYRVLRAMQPTRPASEFVGRDGFSSVLEIDFEAEPEEASVETHEQEGEEQSVNQGGEGSERQDFRRDERPRYNNDRPRDGQRDDRPREYRDDRPREGQRDDRPRYNNDRPRDDRPRDDRPREGQRDDRPRYNNDRPRDDRPRDDRPRDDRPRDDRPREGQRDDRPRDDRPREDRSRDDRQRERLERQERYDRERPAEAVVEQPVAAPRDEPSQPRLRGQDGAISEAPAFLSRGAPEPRSDGPRADVAADVEGEAPKKRGRPRKAAAEEA